MSIYQLYGTASSDTDSVANLDIQFPGHIVAYSCHLNAVGMDALNDGAGMEVSFLSSNCFTTNDCRGTIGRATLLAGVLTSGGFPASTDSNLAGLSIPVAAGERVHLHIDLQGGTTSATAYAILYIADQTDPNLRRRR